VYDEAGNHLRECYPKIFGLCEKAGDVFLVKEVETQFLDCVWRIINNGHGRYTFASPEKMAEYSAFISVDSVTKEATATMEVKSGGESWRGFYEYGHQCCQPMCENY